MSNLLTLSQDEIERFNLKGKEVGDVITAEEYSKLQKEYEANRNKSEDKPEDKPEVDTSSKTSSKTFSKTPIKK